MAAIPEVGASCEKLDDVDLTEAENGELPPIQSASALHCGERDIGGEILLTYWELEGGDDVDAAARELVLGGRSVLPDFVPPEDFAYFVNGSVLVVPTKARIDAGILEPKAAAQAIEEACGCGFVVIPETES